MKQFSISSTDQRRECRPVVAHERAGTYALDGARRGAAGSAPGPAAPSLREQIQEAVTAVGAIRDLPLENLGAGELTAAIRDFGRVERAATAVRAQLVAAAAAASSSDEEGATSMTSLLRHQLGLSGSQARKAAQLAEDLALVPSAADALARGEIGAEQAAIVGEAAREGRLGSGADAEDALLADAGRLSPEQLRRVRARREAEADPDGLREQEAHAIRNRRASIRRRNGMWMLEAQMDPLRGAKVEGALRQLATFDGPEVPDDAKRTAGQRMADALVRMSELAADHPDADHATGERPAATAFFGWETLRELASEGGHTLSPAGELDGFGPISAELARRILCDAQVTRLIAGPDSMPLDVGRATPKWSGSQRRAVVARDGHCRGPSCDRPAGWCVVHHINWWKRDLGPTKVANGLLVCHHHHDLVHHGGWELHVDRQTFEANWTSPWGNVITTRPNGPMMLSTEERNRRRRRPAGSDDPGGTPGAAAGPDPGPDDSRDPSPGVAAGQPRLLD